MIRSLFRPGSGGIQVDLPPAQYRDATTDPSGLLWVDLAECSASEGQDVMAGVFGFHPLAIEDALQQVHYPKVDDYGDYLYLVMHGVQIPIARVPFQTLELDVFLGPNYLVTHHAAPMPAVDEVWELTRQDERHLSRGAALLLYDVLERLAANFMPALDELEDGIDRLQDEVFDGAGQETLSKVFALRRNAMHMRRVLSPQRDTLNRLSRDEFAVIPHQAQIYFRDIYDHMLRLHDLTENLRDLAGGVLETYLSVSSNRINDVMKRLALISTVFLPLTLLAGIYGTNFHYFPELEWRYGYPAFWLLLVVVASILVWDFRRRRWM